MPMFSPVSLQSPPSMKAVLQAGWLMTVAVGNLIVVIIAGADTISDQVNMAEKSALNSFCTSVVITSRRSLGKGMFPVVSIFPQGDPYVIWHMRHPESCPIPKHMGPPVQTCLLRTSPNPFKLFHLDMLTRRRLASN